MYIYIYIYIYILCYAMLCHVTLCLSLGGPCDAVMPPSVVREKQHATVNPQA